MILTIRRYPDPCLSRPALPVARIDADLRRLAADMVETMRHASGVGLAAPQVGVGLRLVVVDLDPDGGADGEDDGERGPAVLVNPVLTRLSKEKQHGNEGCLSFPGITSKLRRAAEATVSALDLDGRVREYTASGLVARAFQHELDHLDGLLFVEKLGPAGRLALRDELADMNAEYAALMQSGQTLPEGAVPAPVAGA